MSTNIKYQNLSKQFITEQQANSSDEFLKLYYEDNFLKKREYYKGNILIGGGYFLSDGEVDIEVFQQLGTHLSWTFIVNQEIINGYTVIEYRSYHSDFTPRETFKKVINSDEKTIALIDIDPQTNQPITGVKYFLFGGQLDPFTSDGPDFPVYWQEDAEGEFTFDENGQLEHIYFNIDAIKDNENWDSLSSFQFDAQEIFIDHMMPTPVLNYFTNLEPLVPPF
ncbi:hypothetical protein JL193_08075 [Polaribacter batillariae]|uniref:Uncharacterized protein n=1 Tax=Polaribacter batillariae TaxID=2808900 RepID=A0ABX7T0Z9_9FLAO|nr:hypothetical protein [Polaribacter batillariae]QTD39183.1 hypothetical protein JL193_08075 [Polaribacter batillariae]